MQVHFATRHDASTLFRQTPNGDGKWHDFKFTLCDPKQSADWLVVYDEPPKGLTVRVPWHRRILFLTEPPAIKRYPSAYLNQFGNVVSPMRLSASYRGLQLNQQSGLPWHYGIDRNRLGRHVAPLDWQTLAAGPKKEKTDLLSVICSDKTKTAQQRRRLDFVEYLQKRLGDSVHVFGRGIREISDKADAIAPYRYHIVLENNLIDHFWTEKLADSYLGGSFPFFSGCDNLDAYFSSKAFSAIDIRKPKCAVDTIEAALEANLFERYSDYLRDARRRVMEVHNLFSVCSMLLHRLRQYDHSRTDSAMTHEIKSVRDFRIQNTLGHVGRRVLRLIRIN